MFKSDITLEYYPIPRSFCLSPFYINYTSGGSITLSTDRIVCLKMKFDYEFVYNNSKYSDDCYVTSNTTLNCVIPSVKNTINEDSRIFLNLYYYDLNSPYERTKLQQLRFYYTFDEDNLNNSDICNEFESKCDNCGYCNGNNVCYNFNSSCDNILYNKGCDQLCEKDEIKIDKMCCNINSLDCYGKCNGTAEIVNITSSTTTRKDELTCCLFDCNNACNGLAYMECDECVGGLTGKNSTMDCNGTCNGYGIENECGYCVNISGIPFDYGIDCRGTCDKDLFINNCGICDYMNYSYCEIGFEENEYDHYININKNTRRIEYNFDIINNSNNSVIPFTSDTFSPYKENLKLYYRYYTMWIPVVNSTTVFEPNKIMKFRLDIEMKSSFTQAISNMNNVEWFNITFKSDIYEVYESQIHIFHYNNTSNCNEINSYIWCNNIPGCYGCYYSDGLNSQIKVKENNMKYVFRCVNYNGNGNPCFKPDESSSYMMKPCISVFYMLLYYLFIF